MENDGKMSFIDQNLSNLMLDVFHSPTIQYFIFILRSLSFFPPLLAAAICEFASFASHCVSCVFLMCVIWWNNLSKWCFHFVSQSNYSQKKSRRTNISSLAEFLFVFSFSVCAFSLFLIKSCNQDVGMWEIGCIDGKFPFISRHNEYLNTWFVNTEFFHKSRKNSKIFFCLRHGWCDSVLIAIVDRIYNQWRMGEKAEKMRKLILMDFSYTIEIKHTEVSMMRKGKSGERKSIETKMLCAC